MPLQNFRFGATGTIIVHDLKRLGDSAFRIDWFGQVHLGRTATVEVVFSLWNTNEATGECASADTKRKVVTLPIAYLRLFRIGDIWRNGVNTGLRDYQCRESFDVFASPENIFVAPAGMPWRIKEEEVSYSLPFGSYRKHRGYTHAQCARVTLSNQSVLLIPCVELIRFYFGASGSFLKKLFSGAFALDRLYTKANINSTTLVANIDLAPDISGPAAVTVARIAFDNQAKSAARWIVNSGISAAANSHSYYPKTTFPFLGKTQLSVEGSWIDGNGRHVFVVEKIVSCSHPFPFSKLFYQSEKVPAAFPKVNERLQGIEPSGLDKKSEFTHSQHACVDSNMGRTISIVEENEDESPFPDLDRKSIHRVKRRHPTPNTFNTEQVDAIVLESKENQGPNGHHSAEVLNNQELNELIEIAPESADVFQSAMSAFNNAGSDLKFRIAGLDTRDQTFSRADVLTMSYSKEKLLKVWFAVLELEIEYVSKRALVMLNGEAISDDDYHLAILVGKEILSTHDLVAKACVAFIEGKLKTTKTVSVAKTHHALQLTSVLRTLSLATGIMMR